MALGAGIACTIIGAIIAGASNSVTSVFYILFGIGIGLTVFASIFFSVGYCVVYTQRIARMRQAVTSESLKYSSRPSRPCSWRLESFVLPIGGYSYYNARLPGYNVSSVLIMNNSILFSTFRL